MSEKTLDQMTPEEADRWMKKMDRQWAVIENEINRRKQERKARRGWPPFIEQDDDEEMEELDSMLSKIREARELVVVKERPKRVFVSVVSKKTDGSLSLLAWDNFGKAWENDWDDDNRSWDGWFPATKSLECPDGDSDEST